MENKLTHTLYGDGIHDDTPAIQELIDSGKCSVSLPAPEVCYIISKPLELPSNFSLTLPRFAEIKLKKGSNCVMLKNKTQKSYEQKIPPEMLWYYINEYSSDYPIENIEIKGGIWNFNNKEQAPNPDAVHDHSIKEYGGFGMLFFNVKGLTLSSLTVKDPANFGIVFDTVTYFTVDNICFDYNDGNPDCGNMDGLHLCGNCHFGTITNLKGATYDDLVAINADEGSCGDITNIEVRGIYAEDCHSAARLLAANTTVRNIHISDVYGTYLQYCIGLTKCFESERLGEFDGITLENIYASKAMRYKGAARVSTFGYPWNVSCPKKFAKELIVFEENACPLITIDSNLKVKGLKISNLYRREMNVPIDTIRVDAHTVVEQLILENINTENHTESPEMPLLTVNGIVENLHTNAIYENGKEVKLN